MRGKGFLFLMTTLILFSTSCVQKKGVQKDDERVAKYTGSESCIECHKRFYELWAFSWHGKAMQPVNAAFTKEYHLPVSKSFKIDGKSYEMVYEDSSLVMLEKDGKKLLRKYLVKYSLGGHHVYTFLAPIEDGKLQNLPLAYDYNLKTWFNYPNSAVRHFVNSDEHDSALPWKDRMYTFNTGCYNCHVSQLNSNYDLATDTYKSKWKESGINCEVCHGPCSEHIRVCREAKKGEVPKDLKIIITRTFTPEQTNSACSVCHSKGTPITKEFVPGESYYDHFNVATLEDRDFYPDGRDLGENYTLTGWLMNPCKQKSDLNCSTCHTSSGRNRFKDNPNQSCIQCHKDKGEHITAHTHHKADSPGSVCINCHAPSRIFVGRFVRSDHSFRPPMPEATIKFGSPNSCNQCHKDKSPEWANKNVKKWHPDGYQKETLYWGQLIKDARYEKWDRLDEMLNIIKENKYNEVVVTSFIRLLGNCQNEKKWETMIAATDNKSPLIRTAVVESLNGNHTEVAKNALLKAAADTIKLVRVSAGSSFSDYSDSRFSETEKKLVDKVNKEYLESIVARPDDWSSHYNMAIYQQKKGNYNKALESYETAARLYPESLMPLINSSVLYSNMGNQAKAEENLRKAFVVDPKNVAVNLNLGLLLAEKGEIDEAEKSLKNALKIDPKHPVAAYNLGVIASQHSMNEAINYVQIAVDAMPENPRYAYTLAFYQFKDNQKSKAVKTLKKIIDETPQYLNAVSLLCDIYTRDGKNAEAIAIYKKALLAEGVSEENKTAIRQAINILEQIK